MASFITRCPHCETSFNITEEQLRIAQGTVRCGFCLQTFSALEHQLFNDEETDMSEGEDERRPDKETVFTEHDADENPHIDNEKENEAEIASFDEVEDTKDEEEKGKEAEEDNASHDDAETDFPGTPKIILKDTVHVSSLPGLPAANEIIHDESEYEEAAQAFEDFTADEESAPGRTAEFGSDDAEEPALSEQTDNIEDTESAYQEELSSSDSEEEYELNTLIEESAQEAAEQEAFFRAEEVPEISPASESLAAKTARKQELEHLDSLYDESELSQLEDSNIDALSDEPIAIYHQQQRSALLKAALVSANLILILLLAGQYVWGNLEAILQNDRLSPFSSTLCSWISCPETEQFDLSRFATEELLVNAHPDIDNALLVDFIFRNTAAYAQQFPLVELNFTDINQRLLANRLFSPQEYLEAELRQFTQIPAQSSVQIRLEIADPGPAAINYTLALRTPSMAR